MKAFVIFYVLIIWLNVFHLGLCNFTCDHLLNKTEYHSERGSFEDLNFTIPRSCYPSNGALISSVEVSNLTADLHQLYCQVIHQADGNCTPPSKVQNCTCTRDGFYRIRIWVQGDQEEKYRVVVTFGGGRSIHDDVIVHIDENPKDETIDKATNSTSSTDDEHGNKTLIVVIVIVVIVVVKTTFIICVIVGRRLRQRDNNATDDRSMDRENHQQFRMANQKDRCPPGDNDYMDYDPLDASYESMKADRYSHAYQGRVTRARKEEDDGPYDDINDDFHMYSAA